MSTSPGVIQSSGGRTKFVIGGAILLGAVALLIIVNLVGQQEYFITVDEMLARREALTGRRARVSGVVIGETIAYDGQTLSFEIAHIPSSAAALEAGGGLAQVLHDTASDPNAARLRVVLFDYPMRDDLRGEAQAIVTGALGEDGVFYADELMLRCPSRYEEALPEQAEPAGG